MAIIPQRPLFDWAQIDQLGDLERLRLVLEYMPDESLMGALQTKRGKGRDDFPVRAMWNSVLAGVVFQHPSVQSLRRELSRNAQLRQLCGFDVLSGANAVPTIWAYKRFFDNLFEQEKMIDGMFADLVRSLMAVLPGFGKNLAIDGKAIPSFGKPNPKASQEEKDHRRDNDADWGKKKYSGTREDGTAWQTVTSWFGYRLHLIVDADYELPVAFTVTKASNCEVVESHRLLDEMKESQEEVLDRCETFLGDRGYDDGKLHARLWDDHQIKGVIDIRNCWKDGEQTHLVPGTDNVVFDFRGEVSCVCPLSGEQFSMAYGGFEKDRGTLKYRCPAEHYGIECKGRKMCPIGKAIRIPMHLDRRIFTPLARSTYRWEEMYKKRTAVERVNSRLDVSFGFEFHFVRGLKKMKLKCALSLACMLAMALGRIKENKPELIRSLVKAA